MFEMVVHALLCCDLIITENNGKKGLIGVFHSFQFPSVPAASPQWFIYCAGGSATRGTHEFSIGITHGQSSDEVFSRHGEFRIQRTTTCPLSMPHTLPTPNKRCTSTSANTPAATRSVLASRLFSWLALSVYLTHDALCSFSYTDFYFYICTKWTHSHSWRKVGYVYICHLPHLIFMCITFLPCSFYPKPSKVENSSSLQSYHQSSASRSLTFTAPSHTFSISSSAPPTSSHHIYTHTSSSGAATSRGPKPHRHKTEYRSQQQLELARALLELPQPRSPAQSAGYHTPSPKPSPGKSKSPGKKKMSSSSPGEHEGYYPCNRCGR